MAMLRKEIQQQPDVVRRLMEGFSKTGYKEKINGRKIFLTGTGASLSACMQAKYAFLKYAGIHATVVPACENGYYMNVFDKEGTVIVVSQSGQSYETKVICRQLTEKGIPFIGVTNEPSSVLGKSASWCLPLTAGEELGTATKTQTASVMLLYLIAAAGCKEAVAQLKRMAAAMESTLQTADGYIQEFADFLGDRRTVYLAGLDAHAPTALQAGLMLKEKVWLHAEGLSLAEFRHGPVEVMQKGMPVVLIAHGAEKMETLLMHADFLSKVCHGDVALVTDSGEARLGGYRNFPYVWEGDEELSHICATLPFQLLAERMAAERNYDIDGFKFIGKILNQYEKPIRGENG